MKKKPAKLTRLEKLASWNLGMLAFITGLNQWVAEATSITTFIAYIPQVIWVLPTLVLLPFCLFAKSRKRVLLLWVCGALWGLTITGFCVPNPIPEIEGQEFTLMTYNIRHAESGWEAIRKEVLAKSPDIVCFQEADSKTHLASAIGELPGYHVERLNGLAIAAKTKPTQVRAVLLAPGTPPALEAKVGDINVVNVQLTSFKDPWSPSDLKRVADIHDRQITTLVMRYGKKPDFVIAGDFNNPPTGRNYRDLCQTFTDAFGSKSWGFGYTYPSKLPLVRIDHAFLTDIQPLSAEVVATTASDHRPVFFKLLLYRPT